MLHTTARCSATYDEVVHARRKYLSPSLLTFEAFDKPLVLVKGEMQYMWDSEGNKYIDLLGQNLCISVGHCHPKVTKAAIEQMQKLPHCTTMYYHEEPAFYAKELVERMPPHPSGDDWVVHLVNDGSEAIDLAIQMARVYTCRPEVIALHKVCREPPRKPEDCFFSFFWCSLHICVAFFIILFFFFSLVLSLFFSGEYLGAHRKSEARLIERKQ